MKDTKTNLLLMQTKADSLCCTNFMPSRPSVASEEKTVGSTPGDFLFGEKLTYIELINSPLKMFPTIVEGWRSL